MLLGWASALLQISQQSDGSPQHRCPRAGARSAAKQQTTGLWNYVLLKAAGVPEKMFARAVKGLKLPRTTEIKRIRNGS